MNQFVATLSRSQAVRFLLLGGTAALVNWLVRFPLAIILPQAAAIIVAYMIGMSAGFMLYRHYVFPGSTTPVARQVAVFLAVNLAGALIVLGTTAGLLAVLPTMPGPDFVREGLAHGVAIAAGAIANFFGHKFLTFRQTKIELRSPGNTSRMPT